MLLAAAIIAALTRVTAGRFAASPAAEPAIGPRFEYPLAQRVPAQYVPAQYVPAQYVPAQYVPAQYVPAQRVPAQYVPAQRVPPRAPAAVAISAQPTWQSRAANPPRRPGLVEDRVPGPAALKLEEAVGPGDQQDAIP
jgi:hypothetical protein